MLKLSLWNGYGETLYEKITTQEVYTTALDLTNDQMVWKSFQYF